jgi:hypothetical protein
LPSERAIYRFYRPFTDFEFPFYLRMAKIEEGEKTIQKYHLAIREIDVLIDEAYF